MKTLIPSIFRFPLAAFSFLFALLLSASAVDTTTTVWNGTNSNVWGLNTNWAGSVLPSTTVSALFNGTFTGGNQPTLGGAQTTQGIWLATGDAQDVTINSAAAQVLTMTGTATLNSQTNAGIYMNDSSNHNLTIGPNTSITLSNATGFYNQESSASTLTISGGLNLNNKLLTIGAGATSTGNVTITGAISSGISGSLTANSGGTVTLSGNNSYGAATTLTGGTLVLSGTNNSTAVTNTTSVSNGILQLANTTANNGGLASGALSLSGNAILQVTNAAALTISNAVILQANSSNTAIVSGSQSLTINGSFTNTAGSRMLTNNMTTGSTLTLAGSVYLSESSINSRTMSLAGTGSTVVNGAIADFNGSGLASGLSTSGGGTITLNGNNTYTGVTTLGVGTVILNGTSRSSSIVVNSPGAVFTESSTGVIASGSLSVGTGTTATLAGNNTYSGGTTIAGTGTLNINSATALGSGNFTISGGTLDNTSGAAVTLTNNNAQAWNGNFAFTGTKDLNLGTGNVSLGSTAGSRTVTVSAGNLAVGGIIANGTATSLTKAGAGTLTLSGANTYTGGTAVTVGTLTFLNTTAKPGTGNTTVSAGATLGLGVSGVNAFTTGNVDSLFANTLANVSMNATSNVGIDTTNGNFTYTTSVSGSPAKGLVKLGANTLTLSGNNTYTGATTVSAGTLLINGSTSSSSAVNVSSGAILGGNGTIGGAVTVNSGGFLAPGNSPGLLTVGSLTLNSGSTTAFEINNITTRGTDYDAINITVASGLTLNGTFTINFTSGTALANTTNINLFGYTGTHTGDFASMTSTGFYPSGVGGWTHGVGDVWTLSSGGQTLTFSEGTGYLNVVPEPATWALLAYSLTTVMVLRRRRS